MKYYTKVREFNLKEWRTKREISCRDFAKLVGADYSYIYRLENGEYEATPEMALKIFIAVQKFDDKNSNIKDARLAKILISEL